MIKKAIFIIFLIIIIFSLSGCNKNNNGIELKINSEIEFLNKEIVEIANFLNNIDNIKYRVVKKENVDKFSESDSTGKSNKQEEDSSKAEDENNKQEEIEMFDLQEKEITNNEIDWKSLESRIERLNTSWPTIANDLKYIGVNEKDINSFGENIDLLIISYKDKNSTQIMNTVVDLYEFLPNFIYKCESCKDKKVILECKLNLLKCYKAMNNDNLEELSNSINLLSGSFDKCKKVYDKTEEKKQFIDICDVIITEMINSELIKDKTVFYIKYKSLMSELDNLF